jgi:hypothetical protein
MLKSANITTNNIKIKNLTNVENVAHKPKIIPGQSFRIVDDCQTLMRPIMKSRVYNY